MNISNLAPHLEQLVQTTTLIHSRIKGIRQKFLNEPSNDAFKAHYFLQTIALVTYHLATCRRALQEQFIYYSANKNCPLRHLPPPAPNSLVALLLKSNVNQLPPLPPQLSSTTPLIYTPIPPDIAPIPAGFEDDPTPIEITPIEIIPIPFEDDIVSLLASESLSVSENTKSPTTQPFSTTIAPEYRLLYKDNIVSPEYSEADEKPKVIKRKRLFKNNRLKRPKITIVISDDE